MTSRAQVELNMYLSGSQHAQIVRMRENGFSVSAVARLAIRMCSNVDLDPDDDEQKGKRVVLYLGSDDAARLEHLAAQAGTSRSSVLRRLIGTFLRTKAAALQGLE